MGLRFNRSIRLFPGVRLNLGLGGASLSVGAPGASVNIGKRGVYGNVGIPGTGLSYRQRLDGGAGSQGERAEITCSISLQGDDIVVEANDDRNVDDETRDAVLRKNSAAIRDMLQNEASQRNGEIEPSLRPSRTSDAPTASGKPIRQADETHAEWLGRVGAWRATNANNAEQRLIDALQSVDWGRETHIRCGLDGGEVHLDVDLPEIEDMPSHVWKLAPRGQPPGLRTSSLTAGETNRRYARMVAGIMRVAIDVCMEDVPGITRISAGGYTTRSAKDEYVVTAEVERSLWLTSVGESDDEMALSIMGAVMEMTSTGRLKIQRPLVA